MVTCIRLTRQTVAVFVSGAFLAIAAWGAPTRIAIVAQETKGDFPPAELAVALLSARDDIVLLERNHIRAVLKEKSLNMAQLGIGRGVSAFGAELGVELLVVVLPKARKPREAGAVVVFDSGAGWRLVDRALENGGAEAQAADIVRAVQVALRRRADATPATSLIVLKSSNVNLTFAQFAERDATLRRLLVRRFVDAGVRVLERNHLAHTSIDRLLGTQNEALPAANWHVYLRFERVGMHLVPQASLVLRSHAGKKRVLCTVSASREETGAAVAQMTGTLLQELGAQADSAPLDPAQEAELLLDEASYLGLAGSVAEALAAAESAAAIAPSRKLDAIVRGWRWCLCNDLVLNHGTDADAMGYVAEVLPELVDAELARAHTAQRLERYWKVEGEQVRWNLVTSGPGQLSRCLNRHSGPESVAFANKDAVASIRAECRRFALEVLRFRLQLVLEADGEPTMYLDPLLASVGSCLRWCSARPAQYPAELFGFGRRWLSQTELASAASRQSAGEQVAVLESMINPRSSGELKGPSNEPPTTPAEAKDWDAHVAFLLAHPDPLVAVYGSVARLRDQVGLKKKTRVQADIVFDDLVERLLRIAEEAPDMGRANRAWLACRRLVQKVCPGPSGMRRSHYLALLKGLLKGKYEPDWRLVEDVAHYCKPRTDEEGAEYFALLESARASHRRYTGTDEGWSGCRLAERAARERIRLCAERLAAKGSVQAVGKVPWAKATCAFRFHRQRGVRINVGHIMLVNEKVGYVLVNRTIGSAKSQTMHFLRFYHTPGSGMREVFRYKLPPTLSSHGAMGVHPRLLLSSSGTLFAASDKLIVVPAQGGGVRVLDEEDGLPVAQCLPMACMGQLLLLETLGWGRAGAKGQLRYTMTYDLESGQLKTIVNPTENRPDLPASARRGVPAGGYWKADEEARCFVRVDPMRLQSLRYNVDRGTWKTVRIRPPWADSPELSRQPFQVRRRMFIQQLRKKRPSYSQRCIVDSWHWQRHPFSRVHQTTKRRELFPKVVAGLSTENVFSIVRQGDLVYVLTQSGLLRLH